MKLLIINQSSLPIPSVKGGAVETLINILVENNEKNSDVLIDVVCAFDKDAQFISNNFKNTRFIFQEYKNTQSSNFLERFYLRFGLPFTTDRILLRAKDVLKKEKYDWVIIENIPSSILFLRRFFKGKVALHLHNDMLNLNTPNGFKILKNYNTIVTVSDFIGNRVRNLCSKNNFYFNENFIQTLYNRVNLNLFKYSNIEKELSEIIVMFTGRLRIEKGALELIKAFKLALEINNNIKLFVLGSSWFSDNSTTPYIDTLKKELKGYEHKITFTGYLNYVDMPNMLSIADIVVIPSIWEEPFGLTVIEAMAMKKAIIVSDSGALPEIINYGKGIVVKRDENFIMNLATSISFLASSKDHRNLISDTNFDLVNKKFNSDNYLSDFLSILNR